jgi:hypothetical protein
MKRTSWKVPGYDCMHAPCRHEKKGDHGISGGECLWAVTTDEGDMAAALDIHTSEYPESIPPLKRARMISEDIHRFRERVLSWSLTVHATFGTDREQLGRGGRQDCELIHPCFVVWQSYSGDEAFADVMTLDERGLPAFEQGEPFWKALEAWLAEKAPKLRAERADLHWRLCPLCGHTDHPGFQEVKVAVPVTEPTP